MRNNDKIIHTELVFVLTHPSIDVYSFFGERNLWKKNSREVNRKYYSNQIAKITTFPVSGS